MDRDWVDDDADQADHDNLRTGLGEEREFSIAERVLERLDVRCSTGPVLVAVEDLQWADPSSLAVLARVAAEIDRLPAAFVVSARPEPRRAELERLLGILAGREPT